MEENIEVGLEAAVEHMEQMKTKKLSRAEMHRSCACVGLLYLCTSGEDFLSRCDLQSMQIIIWCQLEKARLKAGEKTLSKIGLVLEELLLLLAHEHILMFVFGVAWATKLLEDLKMQVGSLSQLKGADISNYSFLCALCLCSMTKQGGKSLHIVILHVFNFRKEWAEASSGLRLRSPIWKWCWIARAESWWQRKFW